ncbi:MAG: hypothetical protein E6J41_23420 [Chloroflexi bacterium]|nr:MAG: hypothetical protein E6J41_23420 [Chloroflexota bacterium]
MVVDDDDINRHGMACPLATDPRVRVAAALSHRDAMGWPGQAFQRGRALVIELAAAAAAPRRATTSPPSGPGWRATSRSRRTADSGKSTPA